MPIRDEQTDSKQDVGLVENFRLEHSHPSKSLTANTAQSELLDYSILHMPPRTRKSINQNKPAQTKLLPTSLALLNSITAQKMVPPILFFFSSFLFSIQLQATSSLQNCQESCGIMGPQVRFPFGLTKGSRCSYPGFDLSCDGESQTILKLNSTKFIVESIDYQAQSIVIQDPGSCLPKLFLESFSLSDSPFIPDYNYARTFTFLNCSSNSTSWRSLYGVRHVPCLSKNNFEVVALSNDPYEETKPSISGCSEIKTVSIVVPWPRSDTGTRLMWASPNCGSCEARGGTCGLKDDSSLVVDCTNLPGKGLPRSAKYGIIIGAGIPGLLCIIGFGCYLCGRIGNFRHRHHLPVSEFSTSVAPQPSNVVITGLDGPTIESYPKTQLGESRRLPKPNDNTCSICLSEYQPKEVLRTIPECSHYFHVECIDEWLKMNATCPLCRNSPDGSSLITPNSSSLSSSASSVSAR